MVMAMEDEAARAAEGALELASQLGLPVPVRALVARASCRCGACDERGFDDYAAALAAAAVQGLGRETSVIYFDWAEDTDNLHGPRAALPLYREGLRFARSRNDRAMSFSLTYGIVRGLFRSGQWAKALAEARDAGAPARSGTEPGGARLSAVGPGQSPGRQGRDRRGADAPADAGGDGWRSRRAVAASCVPGVGRRSPAVDGRAGCRQATARRVASSSPGSRRNSRSTGTCPEPCGMPWRCTTSVSLSGLPPSPYRGGRFTAARGRRQGRCCASSAGDACDGRPALRGGGGVLARAGRAVRARLGAPGARSVPAGARPGVGGCNRLQRGACDPRRAGSRARRGGRAPAAWSGRTQPDAPCGRRQMRPSSARLRYRSPSVTMTCAATNEGQRRVDPVESAAASSGKRPSSRATELVAAADVRRTRRRPPPAPRRGGRRSPGPRGECRRASARRRPPSSRGAPALRSRCHVRPPPSAAPTYVAGTYAAPSRTRRRRRCV